MSGHCSDTLCALLLHPVDHGTPDRLKQGEALPDPEVSMVSVGLSAVPQWAGIRQEGPDLSVVCCMSAMRLVYPP